MFSTENLSLPQAVKAITDGEKNLVANLANVAALINEYIDRINWAGFYLYEEESDELVLGPFQGKPACIRIPIGKGVCGTAAAKSETIIVPDVYAFPGHIACDSASLSEIVLPIVKGGRLIGVLDVDSPELNRFGKDEAAVFAEVVDVLVGTL